MRIHPRQRFTAGRAAILGPGLPPIANILQVCRTEDEMDETHKQAATCQTQVAAEDSMVGPREKA